MSQLKVFLFGPPHVELDGQAIKIGRRKSMALLAYLAVTGKPQSRDNLAAILWPESDQVEARTSLRMTLSALKKAIGEEFLVIERECVSLKWENGPWVDVARFHQNLDICRKHDHSLEERCSLCTDLLSEAADLYWGDFLVGFSLRDSPDFDDWQFFQTENLRLELASILERLAQMHAASQNYGPAIERTRRWVELDTLHEPAHRQLMQLYAQSGQPEAALRQYETCVHILESELGIPPQEETEQLHRAIYGKMEFKASPGPLKYRHNLPHQVTTFVGREREIFEIARMIEDTDSRLTCLVGPGGIGKTRLALEVAMGRVDAFLQGVHFVPLAGVSSHTYLATAIVDSLGVSMFGQEEPKVQLLNYLSQKEMLLVLDNFEHLLEGAGLLSEILSRAPGVKLLVTSRERLNLQGEWVIEIGGLHFPRQGENEHIEAYSAVQLFAQGARRASPGFRLAEKGKHWVANICRLVEGMPLAIELAASWTQVLSCAEIAEEIQHNLDFLSSSLRDIPERHRSIRATFNYSWEFLSEEERVTFARLSVFRGGFTREAAQEVTQASPRQLASLVEKSFLRWDAWLGRYEIHELIRQYATEQLVTPLLEETKDQHCAYFVVFLNRREKALTGEGQIEALQEIGTELENIRLAWQWTLANGQQDRVEHCLESLFQFYDIGSWFQEGRDAFAKAILAMEKANVQDSSTLWRLRVRQAMFELHLAQRSKSMPPLTQGLEFFHANDDEAEMAFCLIGLAAINRDTSLYADATQQLERALSHAQSTKRVDLEARIHLELGYVAWQQTNYESAREKLGVALTLSPSASRLRADCLIHLGVIENYVGNLSEARPYLEQALQLCRQIGWRSGEAATVLNLGNTMSSMHENVKARDYYERALRIQQEIGARGGECAALINLGALLVRLGDVLAAKQYYEQALQISSEIKLEFEKRYTLNGLSLLYHHIDDDQASQEYSQQALQIAQEAGDRYTEGNSFTCLGHALAGLGKLSEATEAYQQAIIIWRDLGQDTLTAEPLAGLARINLIQGKPAKALAHIERILSHLQTNTLDGTDEPMLVYLTCYQILDACQDPRAGEILASSYHSLQEQAAKINDEALQHSFLENIAAHREIIRLWKIASSPEQLPNK